ncbi:uncharacterized protein DS421_7g212720 [Arachis hypogaea]|nr:uncharacterized protein DS421_7g212720 [Arachis hypogaea]
MRRGGLCRRRSCEVRVLRSRKWWICSATRSGITLVTHCVANCVRVFNVVWPILVHEDSGFCCSISELRTPCQFSFLKIFDIDLYVVQVELENHLRALLQMIFSYQS